MFTKVLIQRVIVEANGIFHLLITFISFNRGNINMENNSHNYYYITIITDMSHFELQKCNNIDFFKKMSLGRLYWCTISCPYF